MPIYERPTKSLMFDWAKEHLSPGQIFKKSEVIEWFSEHYPKIKHTTVNLHVEGMSVNNSYRKNHPGIRPGTGHDLFFKMGVNQFRLWAQDTDPAPFYKIDLEMGMSDSMEDVEADDEPDVSNQVGARVFAFEKDLRNYLERNLDIIEPGLKLYEEEGIKGIEFPVGGRLIDILAVDKEGRFVVIELKVSRGYDRVIGQLLRYMGWVEQNMQISKPARGIIVANDISTDLKLAASRIPDIRLVEYQISFTLRPV